MKKIFLSHSSKDKHYVEQVASKLKKSHLIYDTWTFDCGEKIIDEIYKGLDNTHIFVLFISKHSLESEWVQKEVFEAKRYLDKDKIKKFIPFIIDNDILYNNSKIPDWIRNNYNLHYISKPTVCYRKIEQRYKELIWELQPNLKFLDDIFVGRNKEKEELENRLADFDQTTICLIASGFKSIGRRKFLRHTLISNNIIQQSFKPYVITLDERQSIEDLILNLYSISISDIVESTILNLMNHSIEQKINILLNILKDLDKQNEIIFIEDNYCIVQRDGYIIDWFNQLIKECQSQQIIICLLSEHKVHYSKNNSDKIFNINIPELTKTDRARLFDIVRKYYNIDLSPQELHDITNIFTGYPEQIFFAVKLLQNNGVEKTFQQMNLISNYSNERVAILIGNNRNNILFMNILQILAQSNFFSLNLLEKILANDWERAKPILEELSDNFFIDYIDSSKEFIRLNSIVKDYIQRSGLTLPDNYNNNFKHFIKETIDNHLNVLEEDVSLYMFAAKEMIKNNKNIDISKLIPSHYINALADLYHEKKYSIVIEIASNILDNNSEFLDEKVKREILYWKCSALARLRDDSFMKEVHKLEGEDRLFLLGFYYRLTGQYEKAITNLTKIESKNLYHRKNRELVHIYLNTEQYEEALALAKGSYERDSNNPYNIQSYFMCILKLKGKSEKKLLEILLINLENSIHKKAQEMFLTSKAQYYTYIENDHNTASKLIDEAIEKFQDNIYPYVHKLEILYTYKKDYGEIKGFIQYIESKFFKDSDIYRLLPYLLAKYLIYKYEHNAEQNKIINQIQQQFPTYDISKFNSMSLI